MKLKVKKLHPNARLPTRAHLTDAGLDLYADEGYILATGQTKKIATGIAIEIPSNHVGLIWDRSSLGSKGVKVSGGVIDSSYRGEIMVCLTYMQPSTQSGAILEYDAYHIKRGEKIAQLLIQPILTPEVEEVNELEESERGGKGFGSSDLNQ